MRRTIAAIAVLAAPLIISACHATQLAVTWHQPGAQPLNFKRNVAVFVSKDEATRRYVEDKIAAKFPNTVPSYTIIQGNDSIGKSEIAQRLRAAGYDGAFMMRVVDVTVTPTYAPGTYWYGTPYGFSGYWGMAWAYPYDPAYVAVDQVVTMETQIYNLQTDKLIFAARSETTNPASVRKLTDSVLRHVADRLKKDGLLAELYIRALSVLA
jgi:hypothetical protein